LKLWIRLDAALPRDPEVRELAERIGVKKAEAIGLLACVWFAIAEHRPSGDVSDIAPATLEDWAEYEPRGKSKRGLFAAAFVDLFTRDGIARGWTDRQGKLIERMEKDRKRKQPATEIPQSFHGNSAPTERNGTERNETEEQISSNTARLREALPDEYRPDFDAFMRGIGSIDRQRSWVASMEAHLNGMRPPAVTGEIIGRCIRQFVGNGAQPNWRLFEKYLQSEVTPTQPMRSNGTRPAGKTLAATQLVQHIRGKRNPMFPTSAVPEWADGLSPHDRDTVKAFGIGRILNDTNEGTLVSQLAKALEEYTPNQVSAA
jgi:hypothetical protein